MEEDVPDFRLCRHIKFCLRIDLGAFHLRERLHERSPVACQRYFGRLGIRASGWARAPICAIF